MELFFTKKTKRDVDQENLFRYENSIIYYIKKSVLDSDIIRYKKIVFKILEHEIRNVNNYGPQLIQFINPKPLVPLVSRPISTLFDINILSLFAKQREFNDFKDINIFCVFCLFWGDDEYVPLLALPAESRSMYEIFMKDKGYTFDMYDKIRRILYDIFDLVRGKEDFKQINYGNYQFNLVDMTSKIFKKDKTPNVYGYFDKTYMDLLSLLDYTNKYKIYQKAICIWAFETEDYENLLVAYKNSKKIRKDKAHIYYEAKTKSYDFIITDKYDSLSEYIGKQTDSETSIIDISTSSEFQEYISSPTTSKLEIKCKQVIRRKYRQLPSVIVFKNENPFLQMDNKTISNEIKFNDCEFLKIGANSKEESKKCKYIIYKIVFTDGLKFNCEFRQGDDWISTKSKDGQRKFRRIEDMLGENIGYVVRSIFAKRVADTSLTST